MTVPFTGMGGKVTFWLDFLEKSLTDVVARAKTAAETIEVF